jgi:quercetin dioxygenase-like cupin family protein
MKIYNFNDMTRGWFVGEFLPTAFSTNTCEAACQSYKKGDYEKKHMHKIATEISFIFKGSALMNGILRKEGDILVMEPGEATDFKALTDATLMVVKVPSIKGDKYFV